MMPRCKLAPANPRALGYTPALIAELVDAGGENHQRTAHMGANHGSWAAGAGESAMNVDAAINLLLLVTNENFFSDN
jgi:hypothetical protein